MNTLNGNHTMAANGLSDLLRIGEIRHAETPGAYIKQRLAEAAATISNGARVQAQIELVTEAVMHVSSISYAALNGVPVNVDQRTHRFLIVLPWGDSGYKQWGLRALEGRVLRALLMARAARDPAGCLFDYADRQWFLNAGAYKTSSAALEYWKEYPITPKEWLRHLNAWHAKDAARQKRGKTK